MMHCPNCNHEFDMHDLTLDQNLRAILQVLPAFEAHQPLVLEYVNLFSVRPWALKSAKLVRLLGEIEDLFDRGRFTYQKREYEISRAGIAAALRTVCSRTLALPLDGHNYLKKVMIEVSASEAKARSIEADKQHRLIEKQGRRPSQDDATETGREPEGTFRPTKEMIQGVLKDIGG